MNFRKRLKNKTFILSLLGALLLLAQQFGLDPFRVIPGNYVDIVESVFMLLTILGITVDPTTRGIADSKRALSND